jgi:hypothetical protein
VACLFFFTACGSIVDMGGGNGSAGQRRVYVNDAAANDSLRSTLLTGGVYFVMQPGKRYTFQVQGGVAGEYLQLLAASGRQYNFWKNVAGTLSNGTQTYTIQDTTATSANYVIAFLKAASGGVGTRPTKVKLVPALPGFPDTIKVRLVLVRTLTGLSSTTAKNTFAHAFMANLAASYKRFGIVIDTSFQIVEPDQPAMTVDFSATNTFPGGTRQANTVYLYLVDKITISGSSASTGTILGFAPREAYDFASAEVVLSAENGVTASSIAVTAAHEMGHFLGLRHTTSTALDQVGDDDLSNIEDGFDSTGYCGGLTKRMGSPTIQNIRMPNGKPYCLRIAAANCPSACTDKRNLMFPYQCLDVNQDSLVNQQKNFIRQNLSLFQKTVLN